MNNNTEDIRGYNDKVFKAVFSTEKGKILLRILLKDILGKDINNITFLNKEIPVIKATQKVETLDLLIDNEDTRIDIEVNSCLDQAVIFRNLLYFFNITNQDQDGGNLYKTNKVYILINLTRELSESLGIINEVKLKLGKKKYCKNIEIYEVNLDKAKKLCENGDKRDFIRHIGALSMTREELKKFKEDDKFMKDIDKELERLKAAGYVVEDDTAKLLRTVQEENLEIGEKRGIKSVIKSMLQKGMTAKNIINITNVDEAIVESVAKELAKNNYN